MNFYEAIILGIVEGITEFLPISSTGHLILTARLLGLHQSEFVKTFQIAIQLGAVLAVIVLYGPNLLLKKDILKRVLVAFLPTAVVGFIFYKFIKKILLNNTEVVLWAMLIGGVLIILFEYFYKEIKWAKQISEISFKRVFFIGFCQSLAIIPGLSRSAATIIGGLMMGIPRKTIVEFSFLLAIPTMSAATLFDLINIADSFSLGQYLVLSVGFFVSFVVAIFSIKFLLRFIQKNDFIFFGAYRIILALSFWLFFMV